MNKLPATFHVILIMLLFPLLTYAQDEYAGFGHMVDVSSFHAKSFTFSCTTLSQNTTVLVACYDADGKFIRSYLNEPLPVVNKWEPLSVTGKLSKNAARLFVGVYYKGDGTFLYDDMRLSMKGGSGEENVTLKNAGFEDTTGLNSYFFTKKVEDAATIVIDPLNSSNHVLQVVSKNKTNTETYGNNKTAGNFADVNGVRLYYETYGTGEPLVLLHGALESISSYAGIIPLLARNFKVIAVDTRGHGKSSADTTKLTYQLYAEDVNKLLTYLHLDSVRVLGWSDGGNTGLLLAMNHPEKVRQLAILGANLYNDHSSVADWVNDTLRSQIKVLEANADLNFEWRVKQCLLNEPHIDPASLGKISCNTLVMAGEKDVIKEPHTRLIAKSIPHSTLIIFRKTGHEAVREIPELFVKTVTGFFTGK
ncbi:alpha/beta fold hydrolase [Chitinophaga arvensicola]|uniref:Pimeloyl-ACP methyl ester carboxylesterase n=1 Tax=Chitinophaga arvensicola TaxID=29529 RepID=A0A1I0S4U8_9BACT|nr:alpha/beta hydrolase [Chitinophaga arvensicola]SEW49838.1 Pimeloyl-ACP methyl ester carboxylesterase [Chitinophaga arvensicola]